MTDPIKLIIDTDPGVDDAMAIFYAAQAPDIDLIGLTAVFGNVNVDQATRNALWLAEQVGHDIPVARGAERPLVAGPFDPSYHVHGAEGFGNNAAVTPKKSAIEMDAADFLIAQAKEHAGELVICPIGPMTNIATAIQRDPTFVKNVKKIVLMGGSAEIGGNITDHAEANFYHDPEAAQIVMAAECDVTMIGLDVTHKTWVDRDDMASVAAAAPKLGGFLAEIADFYIDFYVEVRGENGCFIHDPSAIICARMPELFETRTVPVELVLSGAEAGRSIMRPGLDQTANQVALNVDAARVKQIFLDGLKRLD